MAPQRNTVAARGPPRLRPGPHVELDSLDVILAEGDASETFVDDDSRAMFHNANEWAAANPGAQPVAAVYAAPRLESGFLLHAIRQRLAAQDAA